MSALLLAALLGVAAIIAASLAAFVALAIRAPIGEADISTLDERDGISVPRAGGAA